MCAKWVWALNGVLSFINDEGCLRLICWINVQLTPQVIDAFLGQREVGRILGHLHFYFCVLLAHFLDHNCRLHVALAVLLREIYA